MTHELYKKHRPARLADVVGQDGAVALLRRMVKEKRVPHALLLSGPSGVGKTTIARVLRDRLGCHDRDFREINAADARGIDTIREIRAAMRAAGWNGGGRMWLLDEVHKISGDGQTALLKLLEDTPKHVYFVLCTTDPDKLLKTIHTRCTHVRLAPLGEDHLRRLAADVLGREGKELPEAVLARLAEVSDGSARKALVLLEQVLALDDEAAQLDLLLKSETKRQAIALARLIMNRGAKWADVGKLVMELEDEPEQLRRLVLGYASKVLAGASGPAAEKAFRVICCFEGNFFDSGKAGLLRACYECVREK